MRHLALTSLLFLASIAAASAAAPPAPLVKDTKTIRLFNGRNLDGLHLFADPAIANPAANWKVEEGVLRCAGEGKGYLRTTVAYADYRLHAEWRWPAKPGNSGIFVNVVEQDLIWPKCIEAQLAVNHAGDFALFSDARSKEELVSRNPTGVSTGRLSKKNAPPVEKPAGEWNAYDIVVSGDTITLTVNGVELNRMTGVQPSGGMIAFQSEGTPIDFRNLEITPLPAAKELNAPMPR